MRRRRQQRYFGSRFFGYFHHLFRLLAACFMIDFKMLPHFMPPPT
jgi:hypothetical protein